MNTNNNNNNNNSNNNGVNDLNELLSLPVNFTVDPLLSLPHKRQASFSSASSVSSENDSSDSVISLKKSRLSLDDKDQKTKER
jgi:hypothetical protein